MELTLVASIPFLWAPISLTQAFGFNTCGVSDGLQPGKNFFTIAVLYAVGIVWVVNGIGGEVRGDDKDVASMLGIVAQLVETLVGVAIVFAWLLAEVVDDDDALTLQLFETVVQVCCPDTDNGPTYQYRKNLLTYQCFSHPRIAEAQQPPVVVVGQPSDDMLITR